jgi:hypothetical protein
VALIRDQDLFIADAQLALPDILSTPACVMGAVYDPRERTPFWRAAGRNRAWCVSPVLLGKRPVADANGAVDLVKQNGRFSDVLSDNISVDVPYQPSSAGGGRRREDPSRAHHLKE